MYNSALQTSQPTLVSLKLAWIVIFSTVNKKESIDSIQVIINCQFIYCKYDCRSFISHLRGHETNT